MAYSMKFNDLDLKGISIEGYALFTAAKAIYCDGADISLNIMLNKRSCTFVNLPYHKANCLEDER